MALSISISAETVAHIGSFPISNSMLTSIVVSVVIVAFAFIANKSLKNTGKPSRFQAFVELIIESLSQLCLDITGSAAKATKFAPLVISFFLFILLNNWFGLIPGVGAIGFTSPESTFVPYFRAGTADLNTTLALAIISVFMTQVFGFGALGIHYSQKYLNLKDPIMFFVGILETVLEFAKIISFAFRLFGNIFAGEVLLSVMTFLVPLIVPMPFYGMELFVGVIQALVFAMLSLVFFNLAILGHEEIEEEHA
ncbi:ATP synthase F0 subunit A [Candidatus Cerribacteria bacterium 'Amazon FNV 2010 28 9']|uniref:ATP synthase subunit a n=1 Tax=Candidatus Cerribacteria bacterium 'Amazon FNV 2010 28 9' TaxID=2081795 RepID=A0A317JN97_9BACT|nr:MAG: ATP synthase F0 subunit A [Candidatus Cerribacteria bacterium 'Amazon FNV 2010 28 9']